LYLTKEEEHIYNGEGGWAKQVSMRILVRLGDLFGAEKLIPIDSAHISGVSYKTLGNAPIEFLKALAEAGGKVTVRTTLNPQSLDERYLRERLDKSIVEKQDLILEQFKKMGVKYSLTCTPYYLKKPKHGSHLAWAESSAVVYANSVLGAWTNREGGPSALAAAIIGKTPDYGVHKKENREPRVLVKIECQLQTETDFGALGLFLGRTLHDKIPVIQGITQASRDNLKQLSAALASSGMTSMFLHDVGKRVQNLEKISVDTDQINRVKESLSATSKPDLIFIGCPHCSVSEIRKVARLIQLNKAKSEIEFWVCTSCQVKRRAEKYVKVVEAYGGHVLDGVCTVVSWTEMLGIQTIMTNSAKTAHYAPTLCKAQPILAPIKTCIRTLVQG
jgi:predicted aconitase